MYIYIYVYIEIYRYIYILYTSIIWSLPLPESRKEHLHSLQSSRGHQSGGVAGVALLQDANIPRVRNKAKCQQPEPDIISNM